MPVMGEGERKALGAATAGSAWRALVALVLAVPAGCTMDRAWTRPEPAPTPPAPESKAAAAPAARTARAAIPAESAAPMAPAPRPPGENRSADAARPKIDARVVTAAGGNENSVVPLPAAEYPIDLSTALRLAEVENPEIAEARAAILEALAVQQGARALLLPTLNAGVTYHGHTGNLQRSSGTILDLSEQSLYVGGGARTLAAETVGIPAVNLTSPLTDALFEPLAARQNVARARFDASATANSVLLDVAVLHLELLYAQANLAAERLNESNAEEVARLTQGYFQTGEGPKSDADRASAEYRLRQSRRQRAEEELAVASAQLARRLHLDPAVRLHTLESQLQPIAIVDLAPTPEDLIQIALRQRPEMAAQAARIAESEMHFRQEVARPLLPTLWVGLSGGQFGGGSNIVPPMLGNFAGRTDIDIRCFWTFQNFGMGNLALQRNRRARIGEAMAAQALTVNQIRREVSAAYAEVQASQQRVEVALRELKSAEAGYREDFDRILNRAERALPIELLDSYELLATARENVLKAIRDLDRAQFQLFVALGSPPPLGLPPAEPASPPPVAAPPLPGLP